MTGIVKAGSTKTTNHRGQVTFTPALKGMPSEYAVLTTVASALLAQSGAHVIGYALDAENNFESFEVYTDEATADFSWTVVQAPVTIIEEGVLTPQLFGAKGDGSNDDTQAIYAALSAAGGNEFFPGLVHFPSGNYLISPATLQAPFNLNVPGNVIMRFAPGACLSINGVHVLFFSPQSVMAGLYQIFSLLNGGTVRFLNDASPAAVYPEWWGCFKGISDDVSTAKCAAGLNQMFASGAREFILTGFYYVGSQTVTAIGSITVRGLSRQSTGFVWTGGAQPALVFDGQDMLLENFAVNNTGTSAIGILLRNAERVTLDSVTIGSLGLHVGFSAAAIQFDPGGGEPDTVTLRNVAVFSQQPGKENAIGFWSNFGVNTLNIEDCIFSGNLIGIKLGSDNGWSEEPPRIAGTHFEAFTNVGGGSAIGLLVQAAYAPDIDGCGFQMSGYPQTAIKLVGAQGGRIASCTFNGERDVIDTNGPTDHMIDIADIRTLGVSIENNWGFGISGPVIRKYS